MTAPVASGWSVRRVGLAPAGKRRLLTAHANTGHSRDDVDTGGIDPNPAIRLELRDVRSANSSGQLVLGACRCGRSHRRDRQRESCVPAGGPVAGVEFAVPFQVHVALHAGDREQVADLRADPDDARLERPELRARSAVAGQLVIDVADRADLEACGEELRRAPIEMTVNAVLVLSGRIDEIVGRALRRPPPPLLRQ